MSYLITGKREGKAGTRPYPAYTPGGGRVSDGWESSFFPIGLQFQRTGPTRLGMDEDKIIESAKEYKDRMEFFKDRGSDTQGVEYILGMLLVVNGKLDKLLAKGET
jgi:hypothetical protein